MVKAKQFLTGVRAEVKKVTWPSKKEAIGGTMVVFVLVSFIAVFLWIVDTVLSKIVQGLISS